MDKKYSEFEKRLGYTFKNKELLKNALIHTSYANENGIAKNKTNERLEFLGDAIVDLVVGEKLFLSLTDKLEGELSKLRAAIVCEQGLREAADEFELGEHILLGKGEIHTGGRTRGSLISDAFEAIIAAIYLDSNFETVKEWILKHLKNRIDSAMNGKLNNDYKTRIQEVIQDKGGKVSYRILDESGPEHEKNFTVCIYKDDSPIAKGIGKSKKEAEQQAAKNALEILSKKK